MNASPPTDTPTDRTAPLALWRVAEAFMHVLAALFGDPSQVAAKHTLTLKAHQLLASWLHAGEAMMRRLLLIEAAAAHAKPNTRPLLRAPRKRTRRLMQFFPETPEKPVLRQDREWLKHEAPLAFRSAWPLAERYEALRRVFANPHTHAQRLARTLHATPHRVHELLRTPPNPERHVDLSDFTETARRSWNTS